MADDAGFRRRVILVLMLAFLVASWDVARLLTVGDPEPAPRTPAPVAQAPRPAPVTVTAPSPSTPEDIQPAPPRRAPIISTGASTSGGAIVVEPDPVPPTTESTTTVPAVAVTCGSDLPLADSPDAPFNFLCVRDGVPVTWPNDSIKLYSSGLTQEQSSALQVARPQGEAQGRFRVTVVNSPVDANVTLGPGSLDNGEDGHTVVHYTCLVTCAFDHVDIQLSSTRALTKPLWITTILHELGHAAGLNHVSRKSQVMYPELDLLSPASYADGDLAGLQELARIRAS